MENTSYIALSRQSALWRQMEVIANNMANANTPGFKAEQMLFTDYLAKPKRTIGTEPVAFVQDIGVMRDTRTGQLTKTDNPLDISLNGEGYFVIDTPDGPRYSRGGHFRLDDTGMLVNSNGLAVLQTGDQPIVFAPNETEISVARDGTISTENGVIGQIRVVRFDNEQELRKAGDGLFATTAQPQDIARPDVVQGMIEESNVQAVAEITNMITVMRHYQGVQKMLEAEHERQRKAIDMLAQVRGG